MTARDRCARGRMANTSAASGCNAAATGKSVACYRNTPEREGRCQYDRFLILDILHKRISFGFGVNSVCRLPIIRRDAFANPHG
jgi:hypothetical protein